MRAIVAFVTVLSALGATQAPRSPLFAAVGTDEYFGETYTTHAEGDGSYVFFVGEPILLRITIANEQATDLSLARTGRDDIFRFELWSAGAGRPIDLVCRIETQQKDDPSVQLLRDAPLRLEPSQTLVWVCPVRDRITPGSYQLHAFTTITDIDNKPIIFRVSSLDFDVRDATVANRPEIRRREALRHLVSDRSQLPQVEAAVQRLLKVHPTSHEAHLIRGHAARLMGYEKDARTEFGKASEILEREQDQLLLKFKGRDSIAQLKASVRRLAEQ